jgi:hypothetical protein
MIVGDLPTVVGGQVTDDVLIAHLRRTPWQSR